MTHIVSGHRARTSSRRSGAHPKISSNHGETPPSNRPVIAFQTSCLMGVRGMRTAERRGIMTIAAIAIIGMIGTGCGSHSINSTAGDTSALGFQVTDPLSGVLNSVDGTTPTNLSRRWARLAELLGLDATQVAAVIE